MYIKESGFEPLSLLLSLFFIFDATILLIFNVNSQNGKQPGGSVIKWSVKLFCIMVCFPLQETLTTKFEMSKMEWSKRGRTDEWRTRMDG